MSTIYTIGHSNHPLEKFLALLRKHRIQLVVDVRSSPYSRFVPHFNRKALEGTLRKEGIDYRFLGDKLGGKRPEGMVDQEGIEEVAALAQQFRTVLLCAEENPDQCHRKSLLAPLLRKRGFTIHHIRGNGEIEREPPALFETPVSE
jgi:uncharacterized protein (DUF488 family)